MSAPSTNARQVSAACLAVAFALVAGCSTSGPRDTGAPRTEAVRAAAEPTAAVATERQSDADAGQTHEARPVPDAALVSHERAVAALAAEDWVEAELELEQLIAAYPDFPGPYVNLAIVYRHDRRDPLAREMLEKALQLDPGHPAANNRLGMLLRESGEFDAAEAAYRRSLATDPAYALAHYNLGVLLDLYLGRMAEALTEYETFQSLQPEPDAEVGRWIVDLRRRLGADAPPDRLAQENSQ